MIAWMNTVSDTSTSKNKMHRNLHFPFQIFLCSNHGEFSLSSNVTLPPIHPPIYMVKFHSHLSIRLMIFFWLWEMNKMLWNMPHWTLYSFIIAIIMVHWNLLDFISFFLFFFHRIVNSLKAKSLLKNIYLLVSQVIVQCLTHRSHAINLY